MTEKCFFCGKEFDSRRDHDKHIQEEHDPNYKKNLYIFKQTKKRDNVEGEIHKHVDQKIKEFYPEDQVDLARSYYKAVTRAEGYDKAMELTEEYNMDQVDHETIMTIMEESVRETVGEENVEEVINREDIEKNNDLS